MVRVVWLSAVSVVEVIFWCRASPVSAAPDLPGPGAAYTADMPVPWTLTQQAETPVIKVTPTTTPQGQLLGGILEQGSFSPTIFIIHTKFIFGQPTTFITRQAASELFIFTLK